MIKRTRLAIALLCACSILNGLSGASAAEDRLIQSIDVSSPVVAPADGTYWMQARAGVVPQTSDDNPQVVITMQRIDRVGTHMYHGLADMWSSDLGKTWTDPNELKSVARIIHKDGLFETPVDMTPQWHKISGKLLVTGATFWQDPKTHKNIPRGPSDTAYTVYDPQAQKWSTWQKLKMPAGPKSFFSRAGCSQRVDLPNGDILLPIYFYSKGKEEANHVTVVRCSFDGHTLAYREHGSELTVDLDAKRKRTGLYEPSLTLFKGKYLLTMRADEGAYVSVSDDGLQFSEPQPWKFDDGQLLGSYNTQQHWVTHSDGLFLAYTRRGADNDNVMRHRAPIFIARVDPEKLVVLRDSEQEVLPNLGKAFGNFGVCNVNENETWLVDCLVRTPAGTPNVYIGKIRWSQSNRLLER
jgi:hypothetical protein